jgi:hypothetical protein
LLLTGYGTPWMHFGVLWSSIFRVVSLLWCLEMSTTICHLSPPPHYFIFTNYICLKIQSYLKLHEKIYTVYTYIRTYIYTYICIHIHIYFLPLMSGIFSNNSVHNNEV